MKITVTYWAGTAKKTGIATSYIGAKRIANRNQNSYSSTFVDERGERLADDGNGLYYCGEIYGPSPGKIVYAVVGN